MYSSVLLLHSWLRWVVLVLGVLALLRSFTPAGRAPGDRLSLLFTIAFDIQFLAGLVLYFVVSPITRMAMQHMGTAMQASGIRFWVVEHPVAMLAALALAHVGRARASRRPIFFAIAIVLLLAGLPWPGLPYGRPFFRM